MREFDPSAVLQMPCIRVVAELAAEEAARHEQHEPYARAIHGRARFVGVDIAGIRLGTLITFCGGGVRRPSGAEIVAAADIPMGSSSMTASSIGRVEGTADNVELLVARQ